LNSILSIQGGMAGGKTTLTNRLEKQIKNVYFTYENPYPIVKQRDIKKLDIYTKEGFIKNQRLFIEAEIKRYNNLPEGRVIFDRGPEDIEFYTIYFPIANGYDWDIELLLKDELKALRKCRSDIILYLDASEETLFLRKESDQNRKRNSFEKNIKTLKYEKDWFRQFNTKFVDVNNKTPQQLEERTLKILKEIGFI
jgi:deoxyadenosine/deoxycytidine kinase